MSEHGNAGRWPMAPLGDLADFRNGINYDKTSFGEGIKVVGVGDFKDYVKPRYDELDEINPVGVVTERNMLQSGDVVFVRSNGNRELIGRSLFIESPPVPLTHSGFTIRARFTSQKTLPRFYAYLFRTALVRGALSSHGGGTNISNLNQGILAQMRVPVPSLEEQHRVTEFLCAYDDLIENCERRIRALDDMARALYREWFVHFRYPGHQKAPLVATPTGQLPIGWSYQRLGSACRLTMGQSPKSEFYNERSDGLPFHQGVTDFGARFPQDRIFCTAAARFAEPGDILFSVRAPVGRLNIAVRRMGLGRGLSAIRHREGWQAYLWEHLRARFNRDNMLGNGAIFAAVTKQEVEQIEILCPPIDILASISERLEPLHGLLAELETVSQNLRTTRDLLLPRLLSGQLSVDDLK